MTPRKIDQATWIKFFALLTAVPRWTGALLASEGFEVPEAWLGFWVPVSALLAAGMAVTEAWAFSFVFVAWRNQRDARAKRLFAMAVVSAIVFIFVLAPYIGSRVRHVTIDNVLSNDVLFWLWSIAVAASTITIIISVGYAQKEEKAIAAAKSAKAPAAPVKPCWCGFAPKSIQSLAAHQKRHLNELNDVQSIPDALNKVKELYPQNTAKPSDLRKLLRKEKNGEVKNV